MEKLVIFECRMKLHGTFYVSKELLKINQYLTKIYSGEYKRLSVRNYTKQFTNQINISDKFTKK